jgi:outer membrane protein OmpA-like peptidoglycan-associated protein
LQAGVGLAWPRPAPPDAPVAPPPAAPPPAAPDARPRDWSWVPHPVSACVETDLLGAASAAAGDPSSAAHVGLPGLALPSGLDLRALLHPTQGSLVVVAQPGDEVVVSGRQVPLGADATAVSNAPEGPIEVQIRGAGQLQVLMPAIASGYAVWVRSRPDPSPAVISFAQGSSTLAPQDLERLAALAQNAGGWRFELRGSSSPEGDAASNRALAQARAQAVKDALLAAGLPAARVQVAPEPEQAAAGLPAAEQRVCKILPLPPEPP